MKRTCLVLLAATLSLVLVAVVGCQQGPSAPTEIKIGESLPITGPLAALAVYTKFAWQYTVDKANADGGVFVKQYNKKLPVKLLLVDNEGKPEKASATVERFAMQDGVVAVLGGQSPGLLMPEGAVAERVKVPLFGVSPLQAFRMGMQKPAYSWDVFFDEGQMSDLQFQIMDTVSSNKKIVLFTSNEEDGTVMGGIWEQKAPKFGYQVAYRATFPVGTSDFGDMIRKAQASGADIMIGQMLPPDAIALWRQMESLNWKPKAAFIEKGSEPVEFWKQLGKSAQGVMVAGFWHPSYGYPGSQELKDAFEKKTGERWSQHISNSEAGILLKAIELAGSLDRDAINKSIPAAAASQAWVAGQLKFADDHTAPMPSGVLQWQDGDVYPVFPKEKATKPLIYPLPSWQDLKR